MYHVTLWRKPRWGDPVAVIAGEQRWLDLADERAMTEEVAGLVVRSGGREERIGSYALQVTDLATGEHVTRMSPTLADLEAVREGTAGGPVPSSPLTFRDVSDEALLRELARRLRER